MLQKRFVKATDVYCSFEQHVNAPYFRRSFELDFVPESAQVAICGLGFYRLYINGKEITKGLLAPYISNLDHFCYYDVYDVKDCLNIGENVIGVLLGNGFMNSFGGVVWDFDKAAWRGAPRFALRFQASGEGKKLAIEADGNFKVHPSPILFDELRMGEHYNANLEIPGWNLPGFDDREWKSAIPAEAPGGEMKKCEAEPISIQKRLKPVSIIKCDDGFLYDFGENTAGLTELSIVAEPEQKIVLWHGEVLKDGAFYNGNIIFKDSKYDFYEKYNQKTIYIAKGVGRETYAPSFTYYGFRYVLVQGINEEQATEDLLTCLVMNSDLRHIGDFTCSDETVNTLFSMVKRSDLANFYYFPTDCPHREKNGWTGDASMSADHMVLLYDVKNSFKEWLHNIRKSQNDRGALPGIVPTAGWGYTWGNGPVWDSVLFNLPYVLYKYRGDTEVIAQNAHAFVRYLEYILTRRNPDGTIAIGLGDWLPVGKKRGSDYDAPLVLTCSIAVMDIARKASEMLRSIGHDRSSQFAHGVYQDMRDAIRAKLLNSETMEMVGQCQSSQALALYYCVFEKSEEERAFQNLLRYIHSKNDSFDCGFLGMHALFHVLSDYNCGELAYQMITKREYPSYGYLLDCGETAMPERFLRKEEMEGSHNHHFLGDISRWFMTRVAGINVIDASHVEIKPDFISALTYAQAYYELPAGKVEVRWEKKEAVYEVQISHAAGIACTAVLPEGYKEKVYFNKSCID